MESETRGREGILTPEEVAEHLRLGRTYTCRLLMTGEIASWKEGRRRRRRGAYR